MIPLRDNLIPTLRYITREQFKQSENREKRCRWCGNPRPKGKTRWCSQSCNDAYRVRLSSGDICRMLKNRDGGRCAACGIDGLRWEADHILPVHQGGGQCGLDNLQTLCVACHKDKTRLEKAVPK